MRKFLANGRTANRRGSQVWLPERLAVRLLEAAQIVVILSRREGWRCGVDVVRSTSAWRRVSGMFASEEHSRGGWNVSLSRQAVRILAQRILYDGQPRLREPPDSWPWFASASYAPTLMARPPQHTSVRFSRWRDANWLTDAEEPMLENAVRAIEDGTDGLNEAAEDLECDEECCSGD